MSLRQLCKTGFSHNVLLVTHDLPEAVLLAHRVLVLSERPARLLSDMAVDLARPRSSLGLASPLLTPYVRQIRHIYEQAGVLRKA